MIVSKEMPSALHHPVEPGDDASMGLGFDSLSDGLFHAPASMMPFIVALGRMTAASFAGSFR